MTHPVWFLLSIVGYFYINFFIVSFGNTRDSADNGVYHPLPPSLPPDHLHILKSLLQNKLLHFLYSDKSNRGERLLTTCHSTPTQPRPHVRIQASPDR